MAKLTFPEDFLWGASTSAFQIEGSPFANGAGQSIWYRYAHTPGNILNGDTPDIACDHYNRWKEDISLMKKLGLRGYRFSISWPRIYPEGRGKINEAALDFYDHLIDELLNANIEPVVMLYHWDLPGALQDVGGWTNDDIVKWYEEYANTLFKKFSDRVKKWLTFDEPLSFVAGGYLTGEMPPGLKDIYATGHAMQNVLLAHANTVKLYHNEYYNGKIGITIGIKPIYPASNSSADKKAVKRVSFINQLFLDPIFFGKYPKDAKKYFNDDELASILCGNDFVKVKCPMDFLAVNYFSRGVVKNDPRIPILGASEVKTDAQYTETNWEVYPEGIYDVLKWVHERYNPREIYITSNGSAFTDKVERESVHDKNRLEYLKAHIIQTHRAIQEGINLRGYFVWSLMDNFELKSGYSKRFGLIYVDYPTQKRIIKDSGKWYAKTISNNEIQI
ncbi:MAG: beta-glucosidase [Thermotoga sp.]|nr:MAG: beta-glucosidase [Thermotoga sp.]